MLDVRARTPEQLRRKGYVTISEVPPMGKDIKRAKKDNRIPKEARKLHPTMWPIFDPFSMLAESYRRLRTTLLRARLDTPLKVVMVTSANPSEGKTTTATNLAATFAETQKRVLLIDADIRRPRIHKILGQQARAGLCELVNDRLEVDKIIQRNVLENLDFISSGNGAAAPSKVFASEAMKSVVDMARDKYDLVVVDVPPVLVVNDAAILSGLVDGTVLVAAAGSTRIAALDKAREILEASGGHVLGVVLNNFDARRAYGRYYGGYHYGHYGSYKGYVSTDGKESKRESGVFDRL
jgi:capsular exopolysaccharide synthesis family protein